jgi:hypothetical protein
MYFLLICTKEEAAAMETMFRMHPTDNQAGKFHPILQTCSCLNGILLTDFPKQATIKTS